MVASTDTIKQILEVIQKHVRDEDAIRCILRDLKKIPGNASFVATIEKMEKIYRE